MSTGRYSTFSCPYITSEIERLLQFVSRLLVFRQRNQNIVASRQSETIHGDHTVALQLLQHIIQGTNTVVGDRERVVQREGQQMGQFRKQRRFVHLPFDGLHQVVGETTHLDTVGQSNVAIITFAKYLESNKLN